MDNAKPFLISKKVVWDSYKRIKANGGAYGVDNQSMKDFEKDLKNNLYKIWNRMSSGSYFPMPVLRVDIPKEGNQTRPLGIPAITDRIAQMVAVMYLEPGCEPYFHPDSYGYRPHKSALDAVGKARQRCWRYDWVVDLDIKGFFDNIDHDLLMKAVERHTNRQWILLYMKRWLVAPIQMPDGSLVQKSVGTPQGGVASPLAANLFLHYVFDVWMTKNFPSNPFERYADDAIVHCRSRKEAEDLLLAIKERFEDCKLELHPQKTKIVYCKDATRTEDFPVCEFDFLSYTFRARSSRNRYGKLSMNFLPAISSKAKKKVFAEIRGWQLPRVTNVKIEFLSKRINPVLRGWQNYYGKFYPSKMYLVYFHVNWMLVKWARKRYKRFGGSYPDAMNWLGKIAKSNPDLFVHWRKVPPPWG